MAQPPKTVHEFDKQLLIDLLPKLQRLPCGYYKRAHDGAAVEHGEVGDDTFMSAILIHTESKLLSDRAQLTKHCINNPEDDVMTAAEAVLGK
jgi:hypothetical protein